MVSRETHRFSARKDLEEQKQGSQKAYTDLLAIAPPWTGAQPVHTHPAQMIKRAVTIEDIDDLYLTWNIHINGSALYRRALREEMELRDIDPLTSFEVSSNGPANRATLYTTYKHE